MRKVIVCLSAFLTITLSTTVLADGTNAGLKEEKVQNYISGVYHQIDFGKYDHLSYEVFEKAYKGYLNLFNAGKLGTDKSVITVCDFSIPSSEKRMWIIDLEKKKVLFHTYVAHGQGSGNDGALTFSNKESSHKSSLGFYVTDEIYDGEHGTSLRLMGMDEGFNDAAFDRGIVVHGADYVSDRFIDQRDRLGRSWGCPAVPTKLSLPIINAIKGGTCLFIYYPERQYLKTAYWLNKKIERLPDNSLFNASVQDVSKPRVKVIQYITNGKIDSVKTVASVE